VEGKIYPCDGIGTAEELMETNLLTVMVIFALCFAIVCAEETRFCHNIVHLQQKMHSTPVPRYKICCKCVGQGLDGASSLSSERCGAAVEFHCHKWARWRVGTKSDLVGCLEDLVRPQENAATAAAADATAM